MVKPVTVDLTRLRTVEFVVATPKAEEQRLDVYLSKRIPELSRSLIQRLIREELVLVNGKKTKASRSLQRGDHLVIHCPTIIEPQTKAEDIPLDVVHEDDDIVVINKTPNFVVHPACGHWEGTLVNALLHHCGSLAPTDDVYRPGIVHRLDKDTSGIIVAAKTARAHAFLTAQFEERTIDKEYLALVDGMLRFDSDVIDKPIGRNPRDHERMAIRRDDGKPAVTYYEASERFRDYTFVRCLPKTGRTHQIRVHLMSIGHPILADSLYGRKDAIFEWELEHPQKPVDLPPQPPLLERHGLHAFAIAFDHPSTKKRVRFEAPLADDMQRMLEALRRHRALPARKGDDRPG